MSELHVRPVCVLADAAHTSVHAQLAQFSYTVVLDDGQLL